MMLGNSESNVGKEVHEGKASKSSLWSKMKDKTLIALAIAGLSAPVAVASCTLGVEGLESDPDPGR